MKILVVGSGGREHALVWKILESKRVSKVYCAPGNGGTAEIAQNIPISVGQIDDLARFAHKESVDLTVVGPELPLTQGMVDHFQKHGLGIIGPSAAAARLEGSKIFAKEFMQRHAIPTGPYLQTDSYPEARDAARSGRFGYPLVIKADGLAAGKGVVIARSLQEAEVALEQIMQERTLGEAGKKVILEKFLHGEEVSFLVFSDGTHALPMVPSQDHKTVFDGDLGPNTGGMGAYSTDWILSPGVTQQVMETIVTPTLRGMAAEGNPYRGILYFGLMLNGNDVKVLEFNARFGDPETQPVLYRLQSDIMEVFEGMLEQRLDRVKLQWRQGCSLCVVMASGGYPGDFEKGQEITGIPEAEALTGVKVFHAGTEFKNGHLLSSGGRVLGVTSRAETLSSAIRLAYQAAERIRFRNMHYRRDIGKKGLKKEKIMAK